MYNASDVDESGKKVLHTFKEVDTDSPTNTMSMKNVFIIFILAVLLGIGGGFIGKYFSKSSDSASKAGTTTSANDTSESNVPNRAGVEDKTTFKDTAEGILREGGIEGEGSFHLERPGGESQNVYLTSSTVDLTGYIGKKVKVWGETYSAQKAGWLMDVGLVETSQ